MSLYDVTARALTSVFPLEQHTYDKSNRILNKSWDNDAK